MKYFGFFTALVLAMGLLQSDGQAMDRKQSQGRTNLIESVTESVSRERMENHTNKGGCFGENSVVTAPARRGQRSFQHTVRNCAERAELAMSRTAIGATHWLGWSLYIPSDYVETSKANIFAQWAAYPTKRTTKFPCGGVGHKLKMKDGWLSYDLQGSSNRNGDADGFCRQFRLAIVDDRLKGRWIDFVQQAKWTGNSDGFVKLWMRVDREPYRLVVDYRGSTWWNNEDRGPYFKMGLYTGDPGWTGRSPAIVYTDEYRLGNTNATCSDVAPDPSWCASAQNLVIPRER